MGRRFRQNLWQILAIVLICLGIFYLIAQVRFAPLVDEIATLAVENKAAGIINQAIDDAIARGDLEYHKIITLEKKANGDISALKTNMAEVNRLKTSILEAISQKIMDVSSEDISVPAGTVLLPELLSGRGPLIPVSILMVTASNATFYGKFSEAGINQTRHQITVQVEVSVTVVTPNGSFPVKIDSDAMVAETVIVGQVPQTFIALDTEKQKEAEP